MFKNYVAEIGVKFVKMAEITEVEVPATTTTTIEIIMETEISTATTKINKKIAMAGNMDSWQNYFTDLHRQIQHFTKIGSILGQILVWVRIIFIIFKKVEPVSVDM